MISLYFCAEQNLQNLVVRVEPSDERRAVILRDNWAETDLHPGDTINIVGSFNYPSSNSPSELPLIIVSAHTNLLITHPDHLLIATAVASASHCLRRPLLNSLLRTGSDASPSLLWGNLLHSVMEKSLADGLWADVDIDKKANQIVQESMPELIRVGVTVTQAKRELKIRAKGMRAFADKYISEVPKVILQSRRWETHLRHYRTTPS
jgi:DNA replication ATP-dependent helicase Dna2